jgi:hypothetical protein
MQYNSKSQSGLHTNNRLSSDEILTALIFSEKF